MQNRSKVYAVMTGALLILIIIGFNYFSNSHGLTCHDMSSICGSGYHGIVQLVIGLMLVLLVIFLIASIFENNK